MRSLIMILKNPFRFFRLSLHPVCILCGQVVLQPRHSPSSFYNDKMCRAITPLLSQLPFVWLLCIKTNHNSKIDNATMKILKVGLYKLSPFNRGYLLPAWMVLGVQFLQAGAGDLGVNLCGG